MEDLKVLLFFWRGWGRKYLEVFYLSKGNIVKDKYCFCFR